MSEPVAVLDGATFDGFVRVEECAPRGMIAIRGDLSSDMMQAAVGRIPVPLGVREQGQDALCWMSPDELLLICDYDTVPERLAHLTNDLAGSHHLAVDMSDARSLFRLTGIGVRDALAKLTPADVSPAAFGPGTIRRTRLAQVPAAIRMVEDDMAEVLCFRSVARYVFDLLCHAARPGTSAGLWTD